MFALSETTNERQLSGLSLDLPRGSGQGSTVGSARAVLGLQRRDHHSGPFGRRDTDQRHSAPNDKRCRRTAARASPTDSASELGIATAARSATGNASGRSGATSAGYSTVTTTAGSDRGACGTAAATGISRATGAKRDRYPAFTNARSTAVRTADSARRGAGRVSDSCSRIGQAHRRSICATIRTAPRDTRSRRATASCRHAPQRVAGRHR